MKNIFPLGLLFLMVVFSGCKKSEPDGIKEYVPAYIKAMAPYTEGQSISFRNNTGQTINATVTISSTFYNTGVCSSCASNSNPELITYTLKVGSSRLAEFRLNPGTYIQLSVYSPLQNYMTSGTFNFSILTGLSQYSCFAGGQQCLTSVTLNGKTFTDVLEITAGSIAVNNLKKAYHTVSHGLVGFEYTDGTTYNLE